MIATAPPPMDIKKTISVLTEIRETLSFASEFDDERNKIILGFLIKETIRTYHKRRHNFFHGQDRMSSQSRACCFYLAKKYSTIPLSDIAKKFGTHPSNIRRLIESAKTAIEIRITYDEFIKRIDQVENNLIQFIKENNISNGSQSTTT